MNKRSLDMKLLKPTIASQDGHVTNLSNELSALQLQFLENKPAMRVECPVCLFPSGILLTDRSGVQTRKCSHCSQTSVFVKTPMGNWKIKSELGSMKIDDRGTHKRS